MEGKKSSFILLIIIGVLTLSLAGLVVYILVFSGGNSGGSAKATPVPTSTPSNVNYVDTNIITKTLYDKEYFNLRSEDPKKVPILQVTMKVKYLKTIDVMPKFDGDKKFEALQDEMKDIVNVYFRKMTFEQANNPDEADKIKEELRVKLNDLAMAEEHAKINDFIYRIAFEKWFVVMQ